MELLLKVKKEIEKRLDYIKKTTTGRIFTEAEKEQALIEFEYALSCVIRAEKGIF